MRLTIRPAWFRLFVGDLSNDVSDDVLSNAFNKYASFQKARVIRDRLSNKASFMHIMPQLATNSAVTGEIRFCCFLRPRRFPQGVEGNGW